MKKNKEEIIAWVLAMLMILGICFVIRACVGGVMYGDWTCGFRKCVVVKDMEE